jgi:hypothetical protein
MKDTTHKTPPSICTKGKEYRWSREHSVVFSLLAILVHLLFWYFTSSQIALFIYSLLSRVPSFKIRTPTTGHHSLFHY